MVSVTLERVELPRTGTGKNWQDWEAREKRVKNVKKRARMLLFSLTMRTGLDYILYEYIGNK